MKTSQYLITSVNESLLKSRKKFAIDKKGRKTFNVRDLYLLLEKDYFVIVKHTIVPLEEDLGERGIYYNNYLEDVFFPNLLLIGPYNNKEPFPWKKQEIFTIDDTREMLAIELSKFIPSHLLNHDGTISEVNLRLINTAISEFIKANGGLVDEIFKTTEKQKVKQG